MTATRVIAVVVIVGVVLALGLVLLSPLAMHFGIAAQYLEIRKIEARMQSPAVYEEVARQLALYCQSTHAETQTGHMGTAWLPKVVRGLRPHYGDVSPEGCRIEMGGGFYHYGYYLTLDEDGSTETENRWELHFYTEESETLLTTVTLGVNERFSDDEFVQLAETGFDERIESDPDNIESYRKKFYFLLKYDQRMRARQVCDDGIKAIPGHWWPRLTAALMDSNGPTAVAAAEKFQQWVEANPSLSQFVYLSYFYDAIGNGTAACEAAAKSVRHPFTEGEHDINNCWFLAYTATIIAFEHGCYETVIEVTDKVLAAGESRNYVYFDFLGMKAAAHFLLGDEEQATGLLETAKPSEPDAVWSRDVPAAIEALKLAIAEKDAEAVKAWVKPEAGEFEPYHDLAIEKIRGLTGEEEPP